MLCSTAAVLDCVTPCNAVVSMLLTNRTCEKYCKVLVAWKLQGVGSEVVG